MSKIYRHHGIAYREIRHPIYRYQLVESYTFMLPIAPIRNYEARDRATGRVMMRADITVKVELYSGYACDGPTGWPWRTECLMRAAFEHDSSYQMMRARVLACSHRRTLDIAMYRQFKADGAPWWLARPAYALVRTLGAKAANC